MQCTIVSLRKITLTFRTTNFDLESTMNKLTNEIINDLSSKSHRLLYVDDARSL